METPGGPATAPSPQSQTATRHERANIMGGAVLIVLGLLFLLGNLFPDFNFGDYWPVLLIVIGVVLLVQRRRAT